MLHGGCQPAGHPGTPGYVGVGPALESLAHHRVAGTVDLLDGVPGRMVARSKTGHDLNAPDAHVFSFRDGEISRTDNFHDTALWAAALS
jgi:ketosteroid isomerase-like protein